MASIQHLILDLGGVIFEIDVPQAVQSFAALRGGSPEDLAHVQNQMQTQEIWNDLERGKISPPAFRDRLREALEVNASDKELNQAWNSLCVGPLLEYVPLLRQLSEKYDLVLLSNTNPIHWEFLLSGAQTLFEPFHHLFLSFEMGYRKPEPQMFEQVLKWRNWSPENCLFFDDTPANLDIAAKLGIQTRFVEQSDNSAFGLVVQNMDKPP